MELFDGDEVIFGFKLLVGEGNVAEVRVLDGSIAKGWPRTWTGYFNDPSKLANQLQIFTKFSGAYVTLNCVKPELLARAANRFKQAAKGDSTCDKDIISRRWLLIDIDPVRPSGISSTSRERQNAYNRSHKIEQFLSARGWPKPVTANSGNGSHLLYRVDLPADDDGLVKRCLEALASHFDDERVKIDTSVHNPARICRLYGTRAMKGDATKQRPHRLSKLRGGKRIKIEMQPRWCIEKLVDELKSGTVATASSARSVAGSKIDEFLESYQFAVDGPEPWDGEQGPGRRWTFKRSPMCDHHDRTAFIVEHANGAIAAGCQHDSCSWTWRDLLRRYPKCVSRTIEGDLAQIEFNPIPASQLGTGEPVNWIWHGYLARGFLTLMVGIWKAGKTTLIAHLLKTIEAGGELAGTVQAAKVLLVTEEGSGLWVRRRDELGIGDHVHFAIRPFRCRPSDATFRQYIDDVATAVERGEYDVVIIDTWSSASPSPDENDAIRTIAALTPLHRIMEVGAAVMLVHHPRKGDGTEGQASRGSGALPGFVDVIIELRRFNPQQADDRRRTLRAYGRFEETPAEVVIELKDGGYVLVGSTADASRSDRQEMIQQLLSEDTWQTFEEVLEQWPEGTIPKPGKRTLQQDLKSGAERGKWLFDGTGTKGSPYRYSILPAGAGEQLLKVLEAKQE